MGSSIAAALQSLYDGSASVPSAERRANGSRNGRVGSSPTNGRGNGMRSPSLPSELVMTTPGQNGVASSEPSNQVRDGTELAEAEAASATTHVHAADGSQAKSANENGDSTSTAKRVTHMANGRITITQAATSPNARKDVENNLQETPFPGVVEQFRDS
eukprot:TRINITY_DN8789_c0_g1_i6.p2 TRINITY_DN8789_c0_g1~~TRINITY_DN8789_c0_g1_i6.p2  ORF type:complete len:159 (-),score=31.07 TRINITY_DN8789_c0_g1_i6:756-1232(-)